MGLLSWLRRRESGEETPTLTFDKEESAFAGLDMKGAIEAHVKWRERLQRQLDGDQGEHLEIAKVSCDDTCALGKWLYSTGKQKYGSLPEFEELRVTHSDFHLCAGEILLLNQAGDQASAESLLKSNFKQLSNRVQLNLVRLYAKASR